MISRPLRDMRESQILCYNPGASPIREEQYLAWDGQ